jgi:DNA polymerase V
MPDDRLFPHVSLLPQVVHAGFPSPGDDYAEPSLNLHDLVVPHPNSTYFIKVSGDSIMWNTLVPSSTVSGVLLREV